MQWTNKSYHTTNKKKQQNQTEITEQDKIQSTIPAVHRLSMARESNSEAENDADVQCHVTAAMPGEVEC